MPDDSLPSSVPEYRIAMHCFAGPNQREKLRQALRDAIEEVGRKFDLSALGGVTVTYDYEGALVELRGQTPGDTEAGFQR